MIGAAAAFVGVAITATIPRVRPAAQPQEKVAVAARG